MTAYKHLLKPEFSLQKKQREALSDWLGVQIQKTKGAGWDVKVKGIRYRAGHNGA